MEGGWGRANGEEDPGTEGRKRNGREEGRACGMRSKDGGKRREKRV